MRSFPTSRQKKRSAERASRAKWLGLASVGIALLVAGAQVLHNPESRIDDSFHASLHEVADAWTPRTVAQGNIPVNEP